MVFLLSWTSRTVSRQLWNEPMAFILSWTSRTVSRQLWNEPMAFILSWTSRTVSRQLWNEPMAFILSWTSRTVSRQLWNELWHSFFHELLERCHVSFENNLWHSFFHELLERCHVSFEMSLWHSFFHELLERCHINWNKPMAFTLSWRFMYPCIHLNSRTGARMNLDSHIYEANKRLVEQVRTKRGLFVNQSYIVTDINGKQIMLKCIAHAAVNYICVVHEVSNDYKISRFNLRVALKMLISCYKYEKLLQMPSVETDGHCSWVSLKVSMCKKGRAPLLDLQVVSLGEFLLSLPHDLFEVVLTLCMLGNFWWFFYCLLIYFNINFPKILSGIPPGCQRVWIQIRPEVCRAWSGSKLFAKFINWWH